MKEAGVVEEHDVAKAKEKSLNSETYKLITSIELNHIKGAREIGLNPDFIAKNPVFLASGEAVVSAIKKNYLDLAREFVEKGYLVPYNLLIDSITKNDQKLATSVIAGKFYTNPMVELEFWFLIDKGWETQALMLRSQEESLKEIFGSE